MKRDDVTSECVITTENTQLRVYVFIVLTHGYILDHCFVRWFFSLILFSSCVVKHTSNFPLLLSLPQRAAEAFLGGRY